MCASSSSWRVASACWPEPSQAGQVPYTLLVKPHPIETCPAPSHSSHRSLTGMEAWRARIPSSKVRVSSKFMSITPPHFQNKSPSAPLEEMQGGFQQDCNIEEKGAILDVVQVILEFFRRIAYRCVVFHVDLRPAGDAREYEFAHAVERDRAFEFSYEPPPPPPR